MSESPLGGATPPDDDRRDAHLRAALRHAPDAQLSPPVTVSEAILREARAALPPPAAAGAANDAGPWGALRRAAARAWAALSRPPLAAGLASVMLASVIGLMWWDRPFNAAGDPEIPPSLAAKADPSAQRAQPRADAPAAPPAAAASQTFTASRKAVPDGVDNGREKASPAPAIAAPSTRPAAASPARERDAAAAANAAFTAQGMTRAEASRRAVMPAPAADPVSAPPPPAVAESTARDAGADASAKRAAVAEAREAAEPAPPRRPAPAAERPTAGASTFELDRGLRRHFAPDANRSTGLAALSEQIAREAPRWTFQRGSEPARPVSPELLAWLEAAGRASQASAQAVMQAVIPATASATRPASAGAASGAASSASAPRPGVAAVTDASSIFLVLLRDDAPEHRLQLDETTLHWQPVAAGPARSLPLGSAAATRLRSALDAATR